MPRSLLSATVLSCILFGCWTPGENQVSGSKAIDVQDEEYRLAEEIMDRAIDWFEDPDKEINYLKEVLQFVVTTLGERLKSFNEKGTDPLLWEAIDRLSADKTLRMYLSEYNHDDIVENKSDFRQKLREILPIRKKCMELSYKKLINDSRSPNIAYELSGPVIKKSILWKSILFGLHAIDGCSLAENDDSADFGQIQDRLDGNLDNFLYRKNPTFFLVPFVREEPVTDKLFIYLRGIPVYPVQIVTGLAFDEDHPRLPWDFAHHDIFHAKEMQIADNYCWPNGTSTSKENWKTRRESWNKYLNTAVGLDFGYLSELLHEVYGCVLPKDGSCSTSDINPDTSLYLDLNVELNGQLVYLYDSKGQHSLQVLEKFHRSDN